MKRFLLTALAVLMGVSGVAPRAARSEQPVLAGAEGLRAALLYEPATDTRLWAHAADERYSVAGLIKLPAILTLAQSFDDGSIRSDAAMQVSERAAGVPGPTAFLERNEQLSAEELMKAAVMISAGDAILALGENAYGSESVLTDNINATFKQLGLGLSCTDAMGTGLLLSAMDLAVLGKAAMESAAFRRFCALYLDAVEHPDGRSTELVNANRMLKNYAGCSGVLTGSSPDDGYCGVFYAEKNGTRLIAVIVGAENASRRAAAAAELFDYGFANYRTERVCKAGEVLCPTVPVRDGEIKNVDLVARESVSVTMPLQQAQWKRECRAPEHLEAPVSENEAVGALVFLDAEGGEALRVPLYPSASVQAFGMKDILLRILALFAG